MNIYSKNQEVIIENGMKQPLKIEKYGPTWDLFY